MKKKFMLISSVFFIALCAFGIWRARQPSLDKMVGQMILTGFRGTDANDSDVRNLLDDIRAGKVGGVILFSVDVGKSLVAGMPIEEVRKQTKSRNIIDADQVRVLNASFSDAARNGGNPPPFVSIDFEGGAITRLGPEHGFAAVVPSAFGMAENYTSAQVADIAENLGRELRGLGFNLDFAPVVDINVNSASPAIGAIGRSFSDSPKIVIEYAGAFADGLRRAGVLYSLKHFPGHGSAGTDSHEGLTDITKTWSKSELLPYRELLHTDMPGMLMLAHAFNSDIDEKYPASLSVKTISGMVRGELVYDGVIISDDLQMGAISKEYGLRETLRLAILAGNDIMLVGNNLAYGPLLWRDAHAMIVRMVRDGDIPRSRIKESYERILKLKEKIK